MLGRLQIRCHNELNEMEVWNAVLYQVVMSGGLLDLVCFEYVI